MLRMLVIVFLVFVAVRAPALASNELKLDLSLSPAGHLETPIVINGGEPGYAVFDTGANIALIDEAVALRNGVPIPPEAAPQIRVLGLTGHDWHPLVHIETMQVGSEGFENIRAALRLKSSSSDRGAIVPALTFSQRFVDIDVPAGKVTFMDRRPRLQRGDRRSFKLREVEGLYFLDVEVNGVAGLALIDTGSSTTLISKQFAEQARGRNLPSYVQVFGVNGNPVRAEAVDIRRMGLGNYRLRGFDLIVFDPPVFEHLGLTDQPMMVLGMDLLRHFRVIIDRERERVWLVGPKNARLRLSAIPSRFED